MQFVIYLVYKSDKEANTVRSCDIIFEYQSKIDW